MIAFNWLRCRTRYWASEGVAIKGTVVTGALFLVVEAVARIFADEGLAVITKEPIVYFTCIVRLGWFRRTDFRTRKGAPTSVTRYGSSGAVTNLVRNTFIAAAELAVFTHIIDKCCGTGIAFDWLSRRTRNRTRGGIA